ncbi:MAG TPA: CehA/McbA family metallohydrolase [Candidatus Limnocylindrales bacterium]|nr:CehA/McbA family metallohydrolase [Candidatus Limnocylindrales bacterium]
MKGVWRPSDRAENRYHYVPFDAGPDGFTVTLAYDRRAGVLDLGLFDPAGNFRGNSSSARDTFTVTPQWATPGYLPGEVPAGQWSVLLGLHRVPPSGLPWEITVSAPGQPPAVSSPDPVGKPPKRTDLPEVDGLRWLAGDLHAHTVHSDGSLSIDELAALAASSGLDFLAVTDHNTTSHHLYLAAAGRRYGITLLPGQEVTTDRGHANAFGDIGWVDFRRPATDWDRGLLSINHPLGADCAWLQPLTRKPRLAEVWHSGWWDRTWGAPLAWLLAWDPATVPVGGSDFHNPREHRLGQPTTWVLAASSEVDDVLKALAEGRAAISESPQGPLLLRVGGEFLVLGAEGLLLAGFDGRRSVVKSGRWAVPAEPGLHWLEDDTTRIMAIAA